MPVSLVLKAKVIKLTVRCGSKLTLKLQDLKKMANFYSF